VVCGQATEANYAKLLNKVNKESSSPNGVCYLPRQLDAPLQVSHFLKGVSFPPPPDGFRAENGFTGLLLTVSMGMRVENTGVSSPPTTPQRRNLIV
jgi:hypothetical protein